MGANIRARRVPDDQQYDRNRSGDGCGGFVGVKYINPKTNDLVHLHGSRDKQAAIQACIDDKANPKQQPRHSAA